jgi:large subunit ribosomal protein L24
MTQIRFKVKKGDYVEVISGGQKGHRGVVSKVDIKEGRAFVEGYGQYVRHIRPSQQNPEGRIKKSRSIHISNVALVDPSTDLTGKIGYKINDQGEKIRFFKESGHVLPKEIRK